MSIINFTVNYDLFASQTDSADAGADADIVALIGDVTFTPVTSDDKPVQAPGYSPRPTGFKLRKFVGYLDSDGRLKASRNGAVGVRLWANDPVFDLDQLTYRVDFDLRTPIGDRVNVDGGYFVAPSTDATINLANVLTSTGSAAVGAGGGGDTSVYANEIVDSTTVGQALMTAANAAAARSSISAVGKGELAVNVKDYGAVGDGIANDRAAIHAARDAAGVGGTLFFPPGTYKVTSVGSATPFGSGGLHANVAGQKWMLGSAEIVLTGADQENLITISAPNVSITGGTLNLSTVADSQYFNAGIAVWSGTVLTGVYGAHGSGAAGAVIRDVTINNASSHGIHVVSTNSVTVTGCTIKDFYSVGIFVQTDSTVIDDLFDFLIHGNRLESTSSYATPIYVGANDQASGNFDTAVARVRRARITNNSCVIPRTFVPAGPQLGAIQVFNAEDCIIDGNVTDGGQFGITTGFLRRSVISNNTCSGWRGIGIEVAGGLDRVAVIGNIIDSDGAGGPFDATTGAQDAAGTLIQSITGISSSGPKSFRNYTIAGNTITGFTTAARTSCIQLFNTSRPSAGGSFESVTISGNTIAAGGGSANFAALSVFAPTTNLTFTGNSIDGSSRSPSTGVAISEDTHVGLAITGNNFANLATAATNLSGTFTDVRFTGNIVRNCTTALTGSGVASATRLVVDSTAPTTSTETAAGTTTLTADSTEVQIFTGSTTQTVRLATTNVLAGRRFTVINASTGSVTVQSSNATVLETVKAGNSATFVALQSTPTTGAHWQETALAGADVLLLGGALGTPSSATLTNATGLPVSGIAGSTSTALGVGSVELGHASDTTLSRSSAGVLAVEGVPVVTTTGTATLTGKTLTAPTMSSPKVDGGAGSGSVEVLSSATDANLNIYCKGTAAVALQSLSHGIIFRALSTSSAVNYLQAASQVAGTAPSISAVGSDSAIGINLIPKSTGTVTVSGNPVGVRVAVPSTATSTGVVGQWSADSSWLYIVTATNTWRRVAIESW